MAKGSYTVGETSTKDSSFRSCLCALLIFLALCVIILLVSIIKLTHDGKENDSKDSMEHLELQRSELTSPKLNEKMILETTTSTEIKTNVPSTSIPNITTKEAVSNLSTASPTTTTTKRPTTSSFNATTTVSSITKVIPETTVFASTERKVQPNVTTTRYSTVIEDTANFSSTTTTKMYKATTTSTPIPSIPFETNKNASLTTETTTKIFTTTKASIRTNEDNPKTTTLASSVNVTNPPTNYSTTQKVQHSSMHHLELQETELTSLKTNEKMILETSTPTETIPVTSTFSTTINKVVVNNSPTAPTTTKSPSNSILNTTTTEATASTERKLNTFNSLTRTVTDEIANFTSTTTTKMYKTTSSTASSPIHIPLETNKNATSRTEITTETSTTAKAPNDLMDVVEATGFDITDEPETSLTTVNDFPIYSSSTPIPIDIRYEKKENETLARTPTTTTTQKIQEVRIPTTTKAPDEPVCLTPGCKSVASRILSLMNHSIDPCEDFYEFACGGMQVDNDNSQSWKAILEQTYLINDESPKYLRTFKTFYDSCISHEYIFDYNNRTAKVYEAVNAIGTIKVGNDESEDIDITEIFAKLVLRRSSYVMDVDLDIDKESSKFILKLSLPSFLSVFSKTNGNVVPMTDLKKRCLDKVKWQLAASSVDLNQVHDQYLNCQKDFGVILNSVESSVSALGFYSHLTDTFNKTQAMQDLRTTIEWDLLDHVNVLPPPNEVRDTVVLKQYTLHKISDLQMNYPFLNWFKFFKILTDVEFDNSTLVQVYFPEYFQQLFQALMIPPKWKINNALVGLYASHLYEKLVIPNSRNNREEYCIQLGMKLFKDISSNLYMKTWSKSNLEEVQKYLTNIFDTVKRSFSEELNASEWADDFSKASMLGKADKMTLTFNKITDSYNDDEHLNKKYDKLNLAKNNFIDNAIKTIEFERKALFRNTGEMYSTDKLWSHFVNIFDNYPTSFYTLRLIMAPLGMMKEPVRGYPGYITMSRIGLLLAREIGRHFNPVGIQYGMVLSPISKPTYDDMITTIKNDDLLNKSNKKFKNQAVSFAVPPDVSANERISDNTGMNLISNYLSTLKAENTLPWISGTFSKEKIFFISIAQDYCQVTDMIDYMLALYESEILPPSLRVENIVTNSEVFASTFSCPEGSYMNNNPWKTQFPNLIQRIPV